MVSGVLKTTKRASNASQRLLPTSVIYDFQLVARNCCTSINSSTSTSVTPTSIRCAGKSGPSSAPGARVWRSIRGGTTTIGQGVSATGVTAASGPSTTSPIHCFTRASARCHIGFSPPSCCACRVRLAELHESWGCMAGRAIAGAGGYAIPPCLRRPIASWRALSKPMTSTIPLARRAKPSTVGKRRWGTGRVGVARNASRAEAIMTKTGRRLSPGSAGRARSSSMRPAISPSRRCRRRRTSRCTQAVGSTPTRRAATAP
jgi:hypothetical protein